MEAGNVMPGTTSWRGEAELRRRGILAFLAIAFGLTWIPFLAMPLGLGSFGTILILFRGADVVVA